MKTKVKQIGTLIVLLFITTIATAATVRGTIKDKSNAEPLIGATVQVVGTTMGAVADLDGNYSLSLEAGTYTLEVKYVSFSTQSITITVDATESKELDFLLEQEKQEMQEVTVKARVKRSSESAIIATTRNSVLVQSGISAQQITRTQDKDAAEVIRRIPGISIIDDKFVMVRGLSQRYNNVWINGSAVPSSEADSRAFSFDIIPSSQLDNMLIVKSPAPEYPADFCGGFILINTKDVPEKNAVSVNVGVSANTQTHFRDFLYAKRSGTDFLGFDNGMRGLKGGMEATPKTFSNGGVNLLNNGFNNDWRVRDTRPLANKNFSINASRLFGKEDGDRLAMLGSLTYSNSYKTYADMKNSLFGSYDVEQNKSNYLRRSTDDQYNRNVRVGAMLNFTYMPKNEAHRFEFKNIFNQLGKERYTHRMGVNAQNDEEESAEYYYSSRTTYNTQIGGRHTLGADKLTWDLGYAYANRNLPDRRRYLISDALETGVVGLTSGNDISREFTKLNEHIVSASVNYTHGFQFWTLKAGGYAEYRTREYNTRQFYYNWNYNTNTLPAGFRYLDVVSELLQENNYGEDKLYLLEEVNKTNDYAGNNTLYAGYAGANIPLGNFNIYAGVRFEHNKMELIRNTRTYETSHSSAFYTGDDFFPSLNASWKFADKQQLRLSYGESVNRPEFREVSTSVYYDFELASPVQGNTGLKSAYIRNADIRYELYPSHGETVSVALFYKHFRNPIEWTYTVSGGTDLTYSFRNADKAVSYGVEVDIRKNLDFIGLPAFSWTFNGSLIESEVYFDNDALEDNRPMQGQSPYLINTGLFYTNTTYNVTAALLYNRIGKRIVGVGRSVGTSGGDESSNIPHSYEMPRNSIDANVTKKINAHWEVKFGVRDLLGEKVSFRQFAKVTQNGTSHEVKQITKQYRPGTTFSVGIGYNF